MDHHRLGVINHDEEGHASGALEPPQQGSTQGLHLLVRDRLHVGPPRVLQPVGGELDGLGAAGKIANPNLPEVELGELPGQPLEAR